MTVTGRSVVTACSMGFPVVSAVTACPLTVFPVRNGLWKGERGRVLGYKGFWSAWYHMPFDPMNEHWLAQFCGDSFGRGQS